MSRSPRRFAVVASLIQVAHRLEQDRIIASGRRVVNRDATFEDIESSPGLEFVDAINLQSAIGHA